MSRPHILIFNPDQWRGDAVGHIGNAGAVTPVLDALVATEAVSFAQTHCQATLCTPSRCSFLTGLYPHVAGHRSLHHMLHAERGQSNLFDQLRAAGYTVWWGGKNDVFPGEEGPEAHSDIFFTPDAKFFERHGGKPRLGLHEDESRWRDPPGSDGYYSFLAGKLPADPAEPHYLDGDWQMVLGAIDFIETAPKDKPLCIFLPILYPHPPYGVEAAFYDLVDPALLPPRRHANDAQLTRKSRMLTEIRANQGLSGWDESRWTELRRVYYGMCTRADRQFGMVLDALRRAGIYDDTAAFLISDHGDFTGDYEVVEKCQTSFEDCLTRVPMVIKPPRDWALSPGVRHDTLCELVDFCATVYDAAGVEPDYDQFGRSLRAAIADAAVPNRDVVFTEGGRRPAEMQVSEIDSMRRHKDQPANLYYPKLVVQVEDHAAHARVVMVRTLTHKLIVRMTGEDELYDLLADPQECDNRIDDPAYAAIRQELMNRLTRWYLETSDIAPRKTDSRFRPTFAAR